MIERDTDSFNIKVTKPEQKEDGGARARINVKPLGSDEEGYDEDINLTARAASEFSNNIQELFELTDDERDELKTEIMKLKNPVRDKASVTPDREQDGSEQSKQEEEFYNMLHKVLKNDREMDRKKLKDDHDIEILDRLDPEDDLIFQVEGNVTLTDEGAQEVRDYLGFESFDGDPVAKAEEQLEDNPLRYYLDAFNRIHKGDHLLKIWELISALSAKCADRQIHSWAVGPSGKGKSHLKRQLLKFLPNNAYIQKESFSPKALQYKTNSNPSDFMDNKLVYFDEVGENIENAIELIRLLTDQDKDEITHEAVKDQEVITLNMDTGNITVWFTSVETIQDEQLKNRFILTNPDASAAQDETVNEHQQEILNRGGDLDMMPKEAPVVQRMVSTLREEAPDLQPIVPFKIEWKQKFNRRLYPFFYTLMGMVAKIHHRNREVRGNMIFVTKADFELSKLIWGTLIDTTVAQTDEQSIELLRELPESRANALTRDELRTRISGFTTRKVKETTEKLEETEELQLINTDYDGENFIHWAGEDVKKLIDNKPEIESLDRETVEDMIEKTGVPVEEEQEIVDSIFNSEIPVIDYLIEKIEEREEEIREETTEVSISDEQEEVLQKFKEYEWKIKVNSLSKIMDDHDVADIVTSLEEDEVVRVDDGDVSPTSKLDDLKTEGEVRL